MNQSTLLEVNGLSVKEAGRFILNDISFTISEGECWAFSGPSGCGKTSLLKRICNYKLFPGNISFRKADPKVILIPHQYFFKDKTGSSNFYYQQRFNSPEADVTETVMDDLMSEGLSDKQAINYLSQLQVSYISDRPLIQLSNGEKKRYQIAKAISKKPEWLLLDEPFTGLDKESRQLLTNILSKLIKNGIRIIIVTTGELPSFVTHVATVNHGILNDIFDRDSVLEKNYYDNTRVSSFINEIPEPCEIFPADCIIHMDNVHVAYNRKEVLRGINWDVYAGEKWCISGPNGSGKSTLLSLITGDHPQAFASDVYMFGKKRGSGETIWEIKKQIGFLSPELHQYFNKSFTVFDTVASGLFDTIGLFKKLSKSQIETVNKYLRYFSLNGDSKKFLRMLPNGRQRWILLARAFVKNPPILILDEPCQGLDDEMSKQFLHFIETVCSGSARTLLYVSHLQKEIPECIDNSITLNEGKIIEIKKHGKAINSYFRRRNRA